MNQAAKRERMRRVRSVCVGLALLRSRHIGDENAWFQNRMEHVRYYLRKAWRYGR